VGFIHFPSFNIRVSMYITTSVLLLRDFLNLQCALNMESSMRIEEEIQRTQKLFLVFRGERKYKPLPRGKELTLGSASLCKLYLDLRCNILQKILNIGEPG